MNTCIDIEKAIEIINKRNTTVDQLCNFLYKDIQAYQDSREKFHLQEFKDQCESSNIRQIDTEENLKDSAQYLLDRITTDTKNFCVTYASESIDCVLDAMIQKKFKTKKGYDSLLVLLSTLKEMNKNQ
jgi:hypothetical protein